jgi:hypothetical protein
MNRELLSSHSNNVNHHTYCTGSLAAASSFAGFHAAALIATHI